MVLDYTTISFQLIALILSFSRVHSKETCEVFLESNKTNRTIAMSNWRQAGLYDRYNVIHGLTRLANHTGSRVYLEQPCVVLSLDHNHDQGISCDIKWSDLLDMSKYSNLLLTSRPSNPDMVVGNYYWDCRSWLFSGPDNPYMLLTAAASVKRAASRFIKKWLPGGFYFIHLRFGDVHPNCDHAQPAILERLSNLKSKIEYEGRSIAIASNSQLSSSFLKQISEVTKADPVVWLDPILQNSPNTSISGNNYLMFNLEMELMKRSMYKITWHRKFACGTLECVAACPK